MFWRRKPVRWLGYWQGGSPSLTRAHGFTRVVVWCVGHKPDGAPCRHHAELVLTSLPDWPWEAISAHLRCTQCGSIGYVDTRLDWGEVIDFNRGVG